jgi:hypothetical protein
VVAKACRNSYAASTVVAKFERYVLASFTASHKRRKKLASLEEGWWTDLLLERPTVTKRKDARSSGQFFFDAEESTGGFHRLLLQAVCQFYGLTAVSRMVSNVSFGDKTKARSLVATGSIADEDSKCSLLGFLTEKDRDAEDDAKGWIHV